MICAPRISQLAGIVALTGESDHKQQFEKVFLSRRDLIDDRIKNVPSQLSTGEKQRTAIARALLNSPKILLADEPTGNLDPENAEDVIKRLQKSHKSGGTVIIVTHGDIAAKYADRIISLKNGKLSK